MKQTTLLFRMLFKAFAVWSLVVLSLVALLFAGCGKRPVQRDPRLILSDIERAFPIQFPTNVYSVHAACEQYRAPLDANSQNNECIIRLALSSAVFSTWRKSVTNYFGEYKMPPIVDPRFETKYVWWDLKKFPQERFTHSFYEIDNGPRDHRKLDMFFLELPSTNIVYISAFLVKR